MLLSEISYSILEYLRGGSIVDDERLDIRLIQSMVPIKRAAYLSELASSGRPLANATTQRLPIVVSKVVDVNPAVSNIYRSQSIPNILNCFKGHLIDEVSSLEAYQFKFSVVPYDRLRFSGEGKFNRNIIYVSYYGNYLYFKTKDDQLETLTDCNLWAVFEDPADVIGFNVDTMDYPIDLQGIDYIKEAIFKMDINLFINGRADEVSDSSGEIK